MGHRTIVRGTAAEEGQALAEYALILSFVAAVVIVAVSSLGITTVQLFEQVITAWTP